jgi:hypothetical protein
VQQPLLGNGYVYTFFRQRENKQCRIAVVRSEMLAADIGDSLGNQNEGERPQLQALTKQRLLRAEKTLRVLQL